MPWSSQCDTSAVRQWDTVERSLRGALSLKYCYSYMVQALPEHPVGNQQGSWAINFLIRMRVDVIKLV